jgi:hypothetical protein
MLLVKELLGNSLRNEEWGKKQPKRKTKPKTKILATCFAFSIVQECWHLLV